MNYKMMGLPSMLQFARLNMLGDVTIAMLTGMLRHVPPRLRRGVVEAALAAVEQPPSTLEQQLHAPSADDDAGAARFGQKLARIQREGL